MDGWKTILSFWVSAVSFKEGIISNFLSSGCSMNRIYLRKRDLLPISHFFRMGMFIQFHKKNLRKTTSFLLLKAVDFTKTRQMFFLGPTSRWICDLVQLGNPRNRWGFPMGKIWCEVKNCRGKRSWKPVGGVGSSGFWGWSLVMTPSVFFILFRKLQSFASLKKKTWTKDFSSYHPIVTHFGLKRYTPED